MNLDWKNAIVSGSVELNRIWIIITQVYWNVFLGKYWEKSDVVLHFLRKIKVKWKPEVWDFVHLRYDKIRKWRSPIFILSRHIKVSSFSNWSFQSALERWGSWKEVKFCYAYNSVCYSKTPGLKPEWSLENYIF